MRMKMMRMRWKLSWITIIANTLIDALSHATCTERMSIYNNCSTVIEIRPIRLQAPRTRPVQRRVAPTSVYGEGPKPCVPHHSGGPTS